MTIVDIVVPKSGTDIKFSYSVPPDLEYLACVGRAVKAPFNHRTICGFIYEVKEYSEGTGAYPANKLKSVTEISRARFFTDKHKAPYNFLSGYYHEKISTVLGSVLPKIDLKRFDMLDKYYLEAESGYMPADTGLNTSRSFLSAAEFKLTQEQTNAVSAISENIKSGNYGTFLLHGVTASGKTEIYFNLIDAAMSLGKQAIILVPEIFITSQFIHLIKKRFGHIIDKEGFAVFHSKISNKEKLINWIKIIHGKIKLVLGARSAVFAPFNNLGLVIVDEEHDSSYKQQSGLLYNARDFSVMLAKHNSACCVLGSATPSLESYHNATVSKKYSYIRIKNRVSGKSLPEVKIIDLKKQFSSGISKSNKDFGEKIISDEALDMINESLGEKRQVLLFLNRRGFSTFIVCSSCGHNFACKNCSISLVYHKNPGTENGGRLVCHYCGYTENISKLCPECGSDSIEPFGAGIQKLEDNVRYLFNSPDGKGPVIARIDSDIAGSKRRGEEIFKKMLNKEIDILIGTQIAAKGHDFPDIGLVTVVSVDDMLNLPDFRSAEKTFQTISQVSGRAGRGDSPGVIAVQTFTEANYLLKCVAEHDIEGFYETELNIRKQYGYPPYSRIIALKLTDRNPARLKEISLNLANAAIADIQKSMYKNIAILGPSPCPIERIKNDYRYQLIFKSSPPYSNLHSLITRLKNNPEFLKHFSSGKIAVDVDPEVLI